MKIFESFSNFYESKINESSNPKKYEKLLGVKLIANGTITGDEAGDESYKTADEYELASNNDITLVIFDDKAFQFYYASTPRGIIGLNTKEEITDMGQSSIPVPISIKYLNKKIFKEFMDTIDESIVSESGNPTFLNVNDIAKKLGINKKLVTFQDSYDGDKDDIYQKMDVFNIDCSSYTDEDDSEITLQILDGEEFMFIDDTTEIAIKDLHTKKEINDIELNEELIPLPLSELNNKVFKQVVNSYIEANE